MLSQDCWNTTLHAISQLSQVSRLSQLSAEKVHIQQWQQEQDRKKVSNHFLQLAQEVKSPQWLSRKLKTCALAALGDQKITFWNKMQTLTVMQGHGKLITILGERHYNIHTCVDRDDNPAHGIFDLLNSLQFNTQKGQKGYGEPVDLFMETPFKLKQRHDIKVALSSTLSNLRVWYSPCFEGIDPSHPSEACKDALKRDNLRLHATDLRSRPDEDLEQKNLTFQDFVKILRHQQERFWDFRETTFKELRTNPTLYKDYKPTDFAFLEGVRNKLIQLHTRMLVDAQKVVTAQNPNKLSSFEYKSLQDALQSVLESEKKWVELYTALRLLKPYVKTALVVMGSGHVHFLLHLLTHLGFQVTYDAPMALLTQGKMSTTACLMTPRGENVFRYQ
jgi:hypothetical protein